MAKKKLVENKNILVYILIFLGLIIFNIGLVKDKQVENKSLVVSFLDVGQGDAILLNYLGQYQILIDGGANGKKILLELEKEMPRFDNKIEVVIITHPDRDHFVGLIDVLQKYEVGLVVDNGQDSVDDLWQVLKNNIKNQKIKTLTIQEGSYLTIADDFKLSFFNPDKSTEEQEIKNDNSIVARLDYGANSFLFTGDIGFQGEVDMIMDNENVDVDWLKVSHHGSKYASSKIFLSKVSPQWAIISVGENDYGHPTKNVLNNLRNTKSTILRTDYLGTIRVVCKTTHGNCEVD